MDSSEKEKILCWLKEGVRVEDFLQKFSEGKFRNINYASKYPAPQKFKNYVQEEHVAWVWDKIQTGSEKMGGLCWGGWASSDILHQSRLKWRK